MDQCLQTELNKLKKTKSETELIKIADCFLDGHGIYTSNLVSFKLKPFQTNHFLKPKEIRLYQLVVRKM